MPGRTERDQDVQKMKKTSSALRAAGVAGIKSFVNGRPPVVVLGTDHDLDDRAPRGSTRQNSSRWNLRQFSLDGHAYDERHSSKLQGSPSSEVPKSTGTGRATTQRVPRPVSEDNSSEWRESGATFITSQSTPLKKSTGFSSKDSSRSLEAYNSLVSNCSKAPDMSVRRFRHPSSFSAERAEGLGFDSGAPKEALSSRQSLSREREWRRIFGGLLSKFSSVVLICLTISVLIPAVTIVSNSKIQSLLDQGHGDVRPWMKVFNADILTELDRTDRCI